jgi:ribosomal protein S27E
VIGYWETTHAPSFRVNLSCIRCGRGLYRRVVDREPEAEVRCLGCGDDERGCVCPSAKAAA